MASSGCIKKVFLNPVVLDFITYYTKEINKTFQIKNKNFDQLHNDVLKTLVFY